MNLRLLAGDMETTYPKLGQDDRDVQNESTNEQHN